MSKIYKKSIVYTLAILAILTFAGTTMPGKASAQYDDGSSYVHGKPNPYPTVYSISPNVANVSDSAKTVTINGNGFTPNSVARWNGSNRPTIFIDSSHLLIQLSASDLRGSSGRYINVFNPAPGGGYSDSAFFTINGYDPSNVNSNANNANTYNSDANSYTNTENNVNNYSQTTNTQSGDNSNGKYSALASNAVFGSNGFLPSGIIQWILFAIIILLIIIIVRKVMGASDRYHREPLKHA
jgi:hypothetical protein